MENLTIEKYPSFSRLERDMDLARELITLQGRSIDILKSAGYKGTSLNIRLLKPFTIREFYPWSKATESNTTGLYAQLLGSRQRTIESIQRMAITALQADRTDPSYKTPYKTISGYYKIIVDLLNDVNFTDDGVEYGTSAGGRRSRSRKSRSRK